MKSPPPAGSSCGSSVESTSRIRRPTAHCGRAISLGLLIVGVSCGEAGAGAGAKDRGTPRGSAAVLVERDLLDLIAALTPPPERSSNSVHDDWLARRRLALERSKEASPEFGSKALEAFEERREAPIAVRNGLLEAAANANPTAAVPVLAQLVAEYGEDLGVRTEACRLLGESGPERAIEVIGPILADPERPVTSPPDESLLAGWLRAHEILGREPLPYLALIATDIQRDESTRHLAVRALANYPSKLTTSALEEVLTESTGNAYLRRLATQSLLQVVPKAEFCPLVERVYDREADLNFQLFLADVIERHCP